MKKPLFTILILLAFQYSKGQVNDSLKTKTDSVYVPAKTETPANNTRRDSRPMKERIDFGFGTSFWITPSQTYIELAPVLAYRFPKTLVTGLGYRYIFRHDRVIGKDLNAYGPNVFARVNLLPRIYFWTEYEILHNEYYKEIVGQEITKGSVSTDSWFAGLGFIKSGRKGRGGISVQVLYNMLYKDDGINPYYSPITYRVGYYF